ncbi:MAG TPA: M1 family metallopeptidase [Chryseosolibacter sp.]|nr:M1 family metallopeptidase [Chryseosolibacter sp.]
MRRTIVSVTLSLLFIQLAPAQDFRWQQRVEYAMQVKLDVNTHKLQGTQKLTYYNNSKDTLSKVYYHLYFNAFQPGSMMDVRSRNLPDPDPRVEDRILHLKDEEIGYQHIISLKQDGKDVSFHTIGTILEVTLKKPLLPSSKTVFDMEFEAQVPLQVRRSGRDSREGIAYSMTQWYPKMAEYDHRGWHAYPYIAREFHAVWGDFDVKITIDPRFVIGGTGVLQNPDKVGHGYERPGSSVKRPQGDLTWHFVARNVHDFAWAADPDYKHEIAKVPDGPELHFFYQPGEKTTENWTRLKDFTVKHFQFMNKTFGKYPYEVYSVIQGGDGGMEYPMCTLITGERSMGSLIGVTAHEVTHSWYQGVLANNEALYPWMDEGFTDFAANESLASIFNEKNPHEGSYDAYFALAKSGLQEPISQHADHFNTNRAYSVGAYGMGAIFLHQLKYIIGEEHFYSGMRQYYNTWKFRHPEPNDFIRVMEQQSGMQLHWYLNYFVHTTKTIDYSIRSVVENDGDTFVTLARMGTFPMPIDLLVTFKDGTQELYYIPLSETLGNKPVENEKVLRNDLVAWPWVNPTYSLRIDRQPEEIARVEIDPTQRLADVNRKNNLLEFPEAFKSYQDSTR